MDLLVVGRFGVVYCLFTVRPQHATHTRPWFSSSFGVRTHVLVTLARVGFDFIGLDSNYLLRVPISTMRDTGKSRVDRMELQTDG